MTTTKMTAPAAIMTHVSSASAAAAGPRGCSADCTPPQPPVANAALAARAAVRFLLRARQMPFALSLHIAFLCVWSATLLYIPLLFRQELAAVGPEAITRVQRTERWIYAYVMTPSALASVLFGMWLVFERGYAGGWLPVKLALVLLMGLFHVYCGHLMIGLKRGAGIRRGWVYLLLPFAPALLIGAIIVLVTAKPF